MRDILAELGEQAARFEEDPVKRAQRLSKPVMPKRFYKNTAVAGCEGARTVELDGKPVRTPGQQVIALPNRAAAEKLAEEFGAQSEHIDLATMPLFRLANTAIDGVANDPQAVIEDIMRFSASDLVCYRADAPERLVQLQAEAWDPVLDWAQGDHGIRFILSEGVMHVAQPKESVAMIGAVLRRDTDPFRLAALHVMTSIAGSALISLAREAGALSLDEAWSAAHVDEDWNIAQWGEDAEAQRRRAFRRRDFEAADILLMKETFEEPAS